MTSPFNLPTADHLILDTSRGENPQHEDFMRNFRIRKCTQSMYGGSCKKGFKCFNFHFFYERRRPSFRNPDGSSNYSSDVYCQLYNEENGFCPNGDACPYLHGETERLYHVDVFKTIPCEYDLNENKLCEMYGRVCPYAHGPEDMRLRVRLPPAGNSIQFNATDPTSINKASSPQIPTGFIERPPGIFTPPNLSTAQLTIGNIENDTLNSGQPSSSSQDPSAGSWSIWSSSDNLHAGVFSRGSRYNSSSSEECSDIMRMLEDNQEAIEKSIGALFFDDETLQPLSAQISPVEKANTVSVKLPNSQMFDIFESQQGNNACSRCGRNKDGAGKCPMCCK